MPRTGLKLEGAVPPHQVLQRGLRANPDAVALVSGEARFTWRELDRDSTRLAASYLELGLKPGDRVASLMPNRPELILHYLACFKAGLVAAPLNYRYTPREMDHALSVSESSILLAHAERDTDVAASAFASRLPLGTIRANGTGSGLSLEDLIARGSADVAFAPSDPAEPALILFTSGSTGLPKGVTHSFDTLGWVFTGVVLALESNADDVMCVGSSLSHLGGISFGFGALSAGSRIVVPRTLDADEVLPHFRNEKPTVLWMLPAALFRLVRDHGAKREDFESLRLCISGGDKVALELEREFQQLTGLTIDEGYGMTEFGTGSLNPPSGVNKIGSVGIACPGVELSIRDEMHREVSNGTEGRLWVRANSVMTGYWNNPDATRAAMRDGWLDTGDIMKLDADGYMYFCGRKKQIIVHDGSNICPQEIEEAIMEHPALESAGVIGVHDLVHGENVRAYVSFKPGVSRPGVQELIQFARARVGYKAPEEIIVLESLPQTAVGKTDRTVLKRMAEAEVHASSS